jgi:Uma2 family endonuclease
MGRRAVPRRRTGNITFEQFCDLVPEWLKADLLDGVIYVASPENFEANDLFTWLIRLLGDFVEEMELGAINGSRVAFRLKEKSGPEPDIAFVDKSRLHLREWGFFKGPPDLAIEIVSPDSVERDYVDKRQLYESHGVREYWIIDEHEETVTFLRLGTNGKYREVKPRKGEYHSEVLPGFWFRAKWLWEATRPKKNAALAEILARLEQA